MPRLLRPLLAAALLLAPAAASRAQDVRVVAWGDSITYGFYDFTGAKNHCYDGHPDNNPPENCGFTARIDSRLNAETPSWNLEVLNLGKGGEKTPGALTRMGEPANGCPNPLPAINKMKYWQCIGWIQPHDVYLLMEGSNDVTQQISRETIRTNLEQIGLRAEAYGFEVVIATLIPRHPYACIDDDNTKTERVNDDIRALATARGWGLVDTYARLTSLSGLFTNYYQTWTWMKCDPNLPDPPPANLDPLGHINRPGYDKVGWDAGGAQYDNTYERNVKLVLPPRLTLTPPGSIVTGTPATVSVDLPDRALGTSHRLLWSFGDGPQFVDVDPAATPATRDRTYLVPGSYTVTVTLEHPNGAQRSRSVQVSVTGEDLTLFADGFESGDSSSWSAVEP
ncbi:MAG TPA: GDSL-type esterase/lipase family protein [Thermoanaerobaculia bacterium]|nr:GDSL-type esterase/lipase family protein [Thermoanaerobaculia bacterium]